LNKLKDKNHTYHYKNCKKIGLGLAVSQKRVQALNFNKKGLKLEVESKLEIGSKFSFPLVIRRDFNGDFSERVINLRENPFIFRVQNHKPLITAEEYFNLQTENIPTTTDNTNHTAKILMVDDDQMHLLVAKSNLIKDTEEKKEIYSNHSNYCQRRNCEQEQMS
jgi:hypothetical protein